MADLVTVRSARSSDWDHVARLVETMGGHEGVAARTGTEEQFESSLHGPQSRALVAENGRGVVGYGEVHARPSTLHGVREAWVGVLAVAPGVRGRGVGRALLGALERAALSLGCSSVVMEADEWQEASHRFCNVQGYDEHPTALRRFTKSLAVDPAAPLPERFLASAHRAAGDSHV